MSDQAAAREMTPDELEAAGLPRDYHSRKASGFQDTPDEPEPIDIAGQQVEEGLVHQPDETEEEDIDGDEDEYDEDDEEFEEGLLGEDIDD
jgi:hypothetical protein